MRPVQYFNDDYLEQCRQFSTEAILEYLENFRLLQQPSSEKSRLISMKVPESLLMAFKMKSSLQRIKYQTQIKTLMRQWVNGEQ